MLEMQGKRDRKGDLEKATAAVDRNVCHIPCLSPCPFSDDPWCGPLPMGGAESVTVTVHFKEPVITINLTR